MAFAALKDELTCSMCLNVYTDPVLLKCGHNFCRLCIDSVLDSQEASGVYRCPDCRGEFQERLTLQSNLKLCNIAEYFHTTQPVQPETEILCSNCIDSPVPAVVTCLHCEVLLCDNHLRVHSKSPEHVLMEPCTSARIKKCPSHQKALMYFCCDDNSCICVSCLLNGRHRAHQVIDINEAFRKKMEKVKDIMANGSSVREELEEKIQDLQMYKKSASAKTAKLRKLTNITFKEIAEELNDLAKKVQSEITRRQEQTSLSISDLMHQLDAKKDDLSRKMCHMEKLCNTTDPLILLQEETVVKDFSDPEQRHLSERVLKMTKAVDDLDESFISKMVHQGLSRIRGNAELSKYRLGNEAAEILLDVNTAANNICVSGDLKTVSCSEVHQKHPKGLRSTKY